MAITTTSTLSIPATSVWMEKRPTTILRLLLDAIARQPARNVLDSGRASSALGKPGTSIAATRTTETSSTNVLAAKTVAVPATTRSSPPSAGPANRPMLSTVLATTFAAVSSSGVETSDGVNAACADLNTGSATAAPTASA